MVNLEINFYVLTLYYSLISILFAFGISFFILIDYSSFSFENIAYGMITSLFPFFGTLLIYKANSYENAAKIAIYSYTRIIFIIVMDFLIFNEHLSLICFFGAILIIGSNFVIPLSILFKEKSKNPKINFKQI